VAFFLIFHTAFEPDLVHTNSVPDCLNVAPCGEQVSPFFMGAAQEVETISCDPDIRRVRAAEIIRLLLLKVLML